MSRPQAGVPGTVYLLHLATHYRHARHYLGWTRDLPQRIAEHRAGHGSPLLRAAAAAGITFEVAASWPGTRTDERRLHRYKNSPARLCPICRAETSARAGASTPAGLPAE
jgi:predicted GIY-YIG superfamily endonuclease